jgi:hypothetical protein
MSEANGYATPTTLFSSAKPRQYTDFELDGHKFRLRTLRAAEANAYRTKHLTTDKKASARALASANARLIVLCVVNGDGEPVFNDGHIQQLLDMDAVFITSLAERCAEWARLNDEEEDDVEAAKKNSAATTG